MIYNLVAFLKTELPALTFWANGTPAKAPDNAIYVNDRGGSEAHWFNRQDHRVQIVTRSRVRDTAKQYADQVYAKINKRFGLELPAVTVGGVVYPSVKTWAIIPVEPPQYLVDDDSGAILFSFTVTITTTKG